MVAEALEALNEAREKSGSMESEVLFGGIEQQLEKLASSVDSDDPNDGDGQGGSSAEQAEKVQNASRTTEELTVALREQIDQGLVAVEQREDSVFITVGSGGAFPSGTADLTEEARRIFLAMAAKALGPLALSCCRPCRRLLAKSPRQASNPGTPVSTRISRGTE